MCTIHCKTRPGMCTVLETAPALQAFRCTASVGFGGPSWCSQLPPLLLLPPLLSPLLMRCACSGHDNRRNLPAVLLFPLVTFLRHKMEAKYDMSRLAPFVLTFTPGSTRNPASCESSLSTALTRVPDTLVSISRCSTPPCNGNQNRKRSRSKQET